MSSSKYPNLLRHHIPPPGELVPLGQGAVVSVTTSPGQPACGESLRPLPSALQVPFPYSAEEIRQAHIQQELEATGLSPEKRQRFGAELKSKQATLKRHSETLEKQPSIMASERWM